MQRWASVLVGAFLVAIIGALLWKGDRSNPAAAASSRDRGSRATRKSEPTRAFWTIRLRGFSAGARAALTLGLTETVRRGHPWFGATFGITENGSLWRHPRSVPRRTGRTRRHRARRMKPRRWPSRWPTLRSSISRRKWPKATPDRWTTREKSRGESWSQLSEFALFTMSPGIDEQPHRYAARVLDRPQN